MSQTLTYVIGQDRRPHVDNVQDFKVNFDGSNTNWVQARQYERSMRQVFVNIKNEDGTPLDLTGCNVWFEGLLPKNSAGDFRVIDDKGYVALDPTAGRFRFDMPGHAFTVAGSYRQAFFRILKDGNSITTLEFDLDVLADKVIDGLVPRTYISPVEELLNEIETKYQDSTDKLTKMTSDFIDKFTQSMNTLKTLGATVQNGLDALEQKIKQDGLFTQAEADAFKQAIQKELAKIGNVDGYAEPGKDLVDKIINEADDRGINVRHFGATGDGKTDDTDAIQKALDYAAEHNRSAVYAPAGDYVISKSLTINLISFHGDGITSTKLIPKGVDNLFFMQWKAILHDLYIVNSQNGRAINDICLAPLSGEVGTNCVVNNILIDGTSDHAVTAVLVAPRKGDSTKSGEIFSFPNVVSNLTLSNVTNGIKLLTSDHGWINGNVFRDINIQGFSYSGLWLTAGADASSITHNHFSNIQVQYTSSSTKDSRAFRINFGDNNRFDFIHTWQDQPGDSVPSMELRPVEGHGASEINGNVFSGIFESEVDIDPVTLKFNDLGGINLSDWKKLKFNNQLQWYSGSLADKNINILPSSLIADYVHNLSSPLQTEGFCTITRTGTDKDGYFLQFEPSSNSNTSGNVKLVLNRNQRLVTQLTDFTLGVDFDINNQDNSSISIGLSADYYDTEANSDSVKTSLKSDKNQLTHYPSGTYRYLSHFINQASDGKFCYSFWWGGAKIMRIRRLYLVPGYLGLRSRIQESHVAQPYSIKLDSKLALSNNSKELMSQLGLYFLPGGGMNDWFDKNLVIETQRSNGKYVYSYPIYLQFRGETMKIVHVFNEQGLLTSDKQVSDSYQTVSNESFDLPEHVVYAIDYQPIQPENESSPEQQMLMKQSQQITLLQSMVMQQNQDNAKLQATSEQQATQIKQLQQMFMTANQQQAIEKAKEVTGQ